MKIRTGFVSNSSSSSFIIIDNTPENEVSFMDIMSIYNDYNNGESEETHVRYSGTLEGLAKYLKEKYSYYNNFDDQIKLIEDKIKGSKDKVLNYIELSYHDKSCDILNKFVKLGKVEIIYDEN